MLNRPADQRKKFFVPASLQLPGDSLTGLGAQRIDDRQVLPARMCETANFLLPLNHLHTCGASAGPLHLHGGGALGAVLRAPSHIWVQLVLH